jgi:hypothetical protein
MKRITLKWFTLSAALFGAWQLQTLGVPHFKSLHVERLLVDPAHAQGVPLLGFPPGVFDNAAARAPAGQPASASFEVHGTASCVSTTCTLSSVTLTTTPLASDTVAVLFCMRGSSYTISGPTYNGSAMTQVPGANAAGSMTSDIWYITGSAVTTNPATIVATTSGVPTRFMESVYDIKTASSTPTSGNANNTGATSVSQSITVSSNGIVVVDGCQQSPGTGPTMSGGGVTLDDTYLNTNGLLGGHTTTSGSDNITTAVGSGGSNTISLSLAAWGHG